MLIKINYFDWNRKFYGKSFSKFAANRIFNLLEQFVA